MVVALILIGVGIALGLIASAVAAALLGVGVISSSVVVGLLSRNSLTGVRAFLLQCGIVAGVPAGILCAWLGHSLFEAYGSGWVVFVYGALGGILGGIIIALLVDFIVRRLHGWAAAISSPRSLATCDRKGLTNGGLRSMIAAETRPRDDSLNAVDFS